MAKATSDQLKEMREMPMNHLIEQVLPFRSPGYLESFCEKLLAEGIASPQDLLGTTKSALETKLSTHASFNFIEMADTISLRNAIDPEQKSADSSRPSNERRNSERRWNRSRSPNNRGRDSGRDHNRSFSGGARQNSRPHRRNNSYGAPRRQPPRQQDRKPEKPALWKAVENGQEALVRELLSLDHDTEEKYQGWTPLMKAAEEGRVEIMTLLLEKGANKDAANRKGRTALSFAAAPSMKRPTPESALRFLLEKGADTTIKCQRGMTPKAYAIEEKRDEAIKILEDFE